MRDRLPYEELLADKLSDLPLPDINAAWKDMERRLEEEDDDKPLLPPWWKGCAGWALLGVLVLVTAWIILRPEKWFTGKKKTGIGDSSATTPATVADTTQRKNKAIAYPVNSSSVDDIDTVSSANTNSAVMENIRTGQPAMQQPATRYTTRSTILKQQRNKSAGGTRQTSGEISIAVSNSSKTKLRKNEQRNKKARNVTSETAVTISTTTIDSSSKQVFVKDSGAVIAKTNTVISTKNSQAVKNDTIGKKKEPEVSVKVGTEKSDSSKRSELQFSGGIGVQQQIPLEGQKFVPYNSLGRKGTWRDYIPSVYIRLTKPGKWFLQTGFRYGAPQYNKEFIFRQQVISDTGANPQFSMITSAKLKKTYYHQLPLTFNYYVFPGFSVGAGVQMNRFVSAVYENEQVRRNNFLQQDSVLSKFTAIAKGDSSSEFKKTYWQAVIESQYHLKRFSFGARYTFGLQPYIQFNLPGSGGTSYRNRSLEVFIRYELFGPGKSKKATQ